MPTLGSKTRTIRVYPDDLERIEALVGQGMTFSGAVHQLISGNGSKNEKKSPSVSDDAIKEMRGMAECCGVEFETLVHNLLSLLEDGTLIIDGDRIRVQAAKWAADFEETCHEQGVPVEKAAESAIKALKRGGV